MKSSSILIGAAMAGAVLMLPACGDKDYPIENITIVEEGAGADRKAESNLATAILGNGGSLAGRLSGIFKNQVEAAKAKHVVVGCEDLDTYAEELKAAYQRGIVITVVDPDPSLLSSWCASKGMVFPGAPVASPEEYCLISFNRKAASMSIQKRLDGDDIVIEDEGPLVVFTGWLDDIFSVNLKGPDFRSRDIMKRFSPQRMTYVFPIDIPAEETSKGGWCVPAGASLSTTASLTCDIYPMHSFADNVSFSGDLYAVEAELTIHNGGLYNGRWQYTKGLNQYETCGFYLTDCTLGVNLLKGTANGLDYCSGAFAAGPAPASTEATAPLHSGFEWTFDGWLTGGNGLESSIPTPIQEGGWTWNNTSDSSISGLNIEMMDSGGFTGWRFSADALPESGDNTVSLPASTTGDQTFRCSWIWAVPEAKDDTTDFYYMAVWLTPVYGWHRDLLPAGNIERSDIKLHNIPAGCILLIPPSRAEGQRI